MNFKRKAYFQLLSWKQHQADRYAMLLEGARRVGKTHLIREFIANEYEASIYIDFSEKTERISQVRKSFGHYADIGDLLQRLQLIFGVSLIPGVSCIVFDEVQLFPPAREAIKHLVAYGRYHYIESGSLVGIKENVKDILVPSEEHRIKLHSMDFEEFLDAIGKERLSQHIRESFEGGRGILPELHDEALSLFRLYMVVGGMPQSVAAYVSADDTRKIVSSEKAKREILDLYENDIGKYAKGYAAKVRDIFKMIPSALRRHEKKFRITDLGSGARLRRYENAFLWLDDAMVVNTAYNATSPDLGIGMSMDNSSFKCYYSDTGLLITRAIGGGKLSDLRLLRGILYDRLDLDEGMFFENVVAQSIVAKDEELRFYSRADRVDASNTMEIDFMILRGLKVIPIEVKSGRYHVHASLDRMIKKFWRHLGRKYVICTGQYEERDGIVYLPAYMTHCI